MNLSRRNFLGGMAAGTAFAVAPGCVSKCAKACRPGKVALQLYSIREYIGGKKDKATGKIVKPGVGLEKALADVAALGYEGVEFAGYYGFDAKAIKKMLDDNGLVACGTHVGRDAFSPQNYKRTCDFNLGFGNKFICCPGGGNTPPGWKGGAFAPDADMAKVTDFMKMIVEYYNIAAENCGKEGCLVGLHNHQWEFQLKLPDGTTYWDYFFGNTSKKVQMEQDVGWTTCAGHDPCAQYAKYPGRSFTLHAKENGMGGKGEFHAILGQPGEGAKGVEWDRLFPITDADNVQWYVVECERHADSLDAVRPSIEFLKSKGRV